LPGNPRDQLLALFQGVLKAVRGDGLVEVALCDSSVRRVIALGKAAEALAAGAWSAKRANIRSGFLALPRGYETGELPSSAPFARYRGAHPLPDESSLAAGVALERYANELHRGEAVTVLLSGGASACVESPAPGVNLALLRRANAWLLGSGLPITAINAVRARLSRLKGGGLACWLRGCEVNAWVLSDVRGNSEWVGGAPLSAVPAEWPLLPDWLQSVLDSVVTSPAVTVPLQWLAGNRDAVAVVCAQGGQYRGELAGDLGAACDDIVRTITAAEPGISVWGGETTLELPADPGRGGRCRHLALAVAQRLTGRANWCLLAAGTDGWDGTDAVAGACVDGVTLARGRRRDRDAGADLARADSGGFFAGSGEEIVTGPTGTNVNDLVIILKR
jgi:hydroxypyruvate reductase